MANEQFNINPSRYAVLHIALQQSQDMLSNLKPTWGTIPADEAYEYSLQLVSAGEKLLNNAKFLHGQVLDRLNEIEDEKFKESQSTTS